jgi:hypothetical protein
MIGRQCPQSNTASTNDKRLERGLNNSEKLKWGFICPPLVEVCLLLFRNVSEN